jgi:hypothetical protein
LLGPARFFFRLDAPTVIDEVRRRDVDAEEADGAWP